jgi:hypothetical protein
MPLEAKLDQTPVERVTSAPLKPVGARLQGPVNFTELLEELNSLARHPAPSSLRDAESRGALDLQNPLWLHRQNCPTLQPFAVEHFVSR